MKKAIIEVAINESVMKAERPDVPYGPEEVAAEAIACARAGAAIVHFHARDRQTGAQQWTTGYETYAEAYRLIQRECDVLLYPTQKPSLPKEERLTHLVKLGRDPSVRLEFLTWEIGSTSSGRRYDPAERRFAEPDHAFLITHADTIHTLETYRELGVRFSLGLRDAGHIRHLLAYMDMGLVQPPLNLRLFFHDNDPWGLPPSAKGLQVYFDLLPPGVEVNWFPIVYGPSLGRMNMLAAAMGGHLHVGLGENPVQDGQRLSNVEQVKRAIELAHLAGREAATPGEAREMLGIAGAR
jgi:uncharacterized protein (DUF849 family)